MTRNGLSSRPENPTLVSMTVYAVYSFEYIAMAMAIGLGQDEAEMEVDDYLV